MTNRLSPANLVARSTAPARSLAERVSPTRLLPSRQRGGGTMSAAGFAPLTLLAALAVAVALFVIYVYPAYAQEGSAPDKPRGLEATATHNQVVLTWNDPNDDSITGYVVLRRNRDTDEKGHFHELVADTGSAATTYTDTEVAAETRYTYRIKAINEHGVSERSRWYHIDTPAAPEPPANSPATGTPTITGTVQVGETLTVNTSGITDEDGLEDVAFSYQWQTDGTAILGATSSAYTPVEADEGRAATVQVNFTDDAGNDETLTSAPTAAVAAAEPTEPPAQPRDLSATATHNQVVLTWKDPDDDSITGYVILRRNRDTNTEGQFDELAANTGTTAATYTDASVSSETRYTYRIKAINQYGTSERSRWYHIDTPAAPEPETDPADLAPTGLAAALAGGQVVLSWDAPAEDAGSVTGYEILRGEGEDAPATLAADTGSVATTYTDATAASSRASYAYRVKALRGQEQSQASNEARVLLKPNQPTGLIGAAAHDSITLTWDDPNDSSITGYVILRRIPGVDPEGQFNELTADTGTAAATYTDDTVSAETRYTYRTKAINEQGASERSRWLHIDTQAAPASPQSSEANAPGRTTNEPADGDFAASTETTAQVGMGQSIVGRIGTAGDVDWILVQADPGQWFTITLTGYGEGDHTALETPYQQAYHLPDGSEMSPEYALNKGRPPCSTGCTHTTVSQGGSRYVAVASRTEGNTGSYELTVTLERTNEGADMAADVGTRGFLRMLTPQEFPGFNPAWNRVMGQITPGDADWYRIDLEAGKAYRFGLRQSNTELRLRLRDSTGTVIGSIRSGRTIHAAACAEGSHYIEVFRPDGTTPTMTNYVVDAAYTDGLETKAIRGILLNAGQVQLDWQCYGIADSHQVQFQLDGQWTTLSPEGNNPADIQLDYINGEHTAKTAGLPTGDEYADYEFRIARVVDGVATTDYREVSIVVIPDTPGNLRGGWNLRYYPDALTFEWDAVRGDNVFYEVQVKDQEDEEWIDLEDGSEPPAGLIYRQAGKTRIKILAASPRYVPDARLSETGNEHVTMRVRATQYDKVSPWSSAFDVPLAEIMWVSVGRHEGAMTAPGQATLTWGNPHYYGTHSFRLITTHVMYRMDGEWLHLLPGHDVNGVTVAVEDGRAVVSGLPKGQREYEFAIRHLGRTVHPYESSILIVSQWSRTISITTDLATPGRPEATQTGSGQVSVSWEPVADAAQYRLRLWTVDQWTELDGEDDGGVSVTMSGTTAIVSGLPADHYWHIFEVRALGPNGVQQSGWSHNVAVFNQHHQGG